MCLFYYEKIYTFTCNDLVDENIVQQLSIQFYRSNYDIKSLMKTIFRQRGLLDAKNIVPK